MSNPFRACSRTNPCPCCGDIKHKCKQVEVDLKLPGDRVMTETMVLCCHQIGDLPEYTYRGESNNSRWSKYINNKTADVLKTAWGSLKTAKTPSKVIVTKPKKHSMSFAHLLSSQARHQEISQLLPQLNLAPRHQRSLAERGFEREIIHYQLKTIEYKQKLQTRVSDRLAGIASGGMSLANNYSGILIPTRNETQFLSGWQVRLDYDLNCKYFWATSNNFSVHNQQTGEIPLSYMLPIEPVRSNIIALVEGVGFKAIHVANRCGQITIGASGAMFASSPQEFARMLKTAAIEVESNRCLLYADAGAVRNYLVLIQYHKLAQLLERLGFEMRVAWWGQFTKAQPDIDEYLERFELITWQQFCAIAQKWLSNEIDTIVG